MNKPSRPLRSSFVITVASALAALHPACSATVGPGTSPDPCEPAVVRSGAPCASEGAICSTGEPSPCGFPIFGFRCSSGAWQQGQVGSCNPPRVEDVPDAARPEETPDGDVCASGSVLPGAACGREGAVCDTAPQGCNGPIWGYRCRNGQWAQEQVGSCNPPRLPDGAFETDASADQ